MPGSPQRLKTIERLAKEKKQRDREDLLDKDPKKAELEEKMFDAADTAKKEGIE